MQIKLPREKIYRLLGFINSYLNFEKDETNIKFAERIEPVTAIKNNSMGILEVLAEEAKKEGKRIGMKEGRIEGKREGKKEGKREGKKEGERAALLSAAQKLFNEGISMSLIHKCTGLPITQLAKLKRA